MKAEDKMHTSRTQTNTTIGVWPQFAGPEATDRTFGNNFSFASATADARANGGPPPRQSSVVSLASRKPDYNEFVSRTCHCPMNILQLFEKSWMHFSSTVLFAGKCFPHYSGSEATLGYENGTLYVHPLSKKQTLRTFVHGKYIRGLLTVLLRARQFKGPISFSVHTSDDGSSRKTGVKPFLCVHASFPSFECVHNLILPIDPDRQDYAFIARLVTASVKRVDIPYMSRKDAAVWRGSNTGHGYRKEVINRLANLPRVNIAFSKKFKMSEFASFKVILAIDGNSFSSLFKEALLLGSVVVRLRNQNFSRQRHQEWFEPFLQHGTHYLECEDSREAVERAVNWVLEHPLVGQRIATQGQTFAKWIFSAKNVRCYTCTTLLTASYQQQMQSSCVNKSFAGLGWKELEF